MRQIHWLDLILVGALTTHCQAREPVEKDREPEESTSETVEVSAAPASDSKQTSDTAVVTEQETESVTSTIPVPASKPPAVTSRIEALTFTHDSSLCAEVQVDRSVNLQTCRDSAKGQNFLFTRGLDGRFQLRDMDSQLCLGVSVGFFRSLLVAEPCESKAPQFFSLIDYDSSYSLRMDASNSCLDAEDFGTTPGTRIIIYSCTSGTNQKIKALRRKN